MGKPHPQTEGAKEKQDSPDAGAARSARTITKEREARVDSRAPNGYQDHVGQSPHCETAKAGRGPSAGCRTEEEVFQDRRPGGEGNSGRTENEPPVYCQSALPCIRAQRVGV